MCPANAPRAQTDPPSQATAERLSLDQTPKLRALVEGPDGAEILAELQKLMPRRESIRAPRYERDLFARVRVSLDSTPEVAVVRDLSWSGVRLELSSSAHLDVMQARTVSIEMRLPGTSFVSCEATLVRVVEHRQNGVELAFAFVDGAGRAPAFDDLIERLASGPSSVR